MEVTAYRDKDFPRVLPLEKTTNRNVSQLLHALKQCTRRSDIKGGKKLHGAAIASNLHFNEYVASALITMYSRCRCMACAQEVFDSLGSHDVATWNSLMMGYVENEQYTTTLQLFHHMSCKPSHISYVAALKACCGLSIHDIDKGFCLQKGKEFHEKAKQENLDKNLIVANALLNLYARCGTLEEATKHFESMTNRDVITWNTLGTGYVDKGENSTALRLLTRMDCQPSSVTFVVALKACMGMADEDKQFCTDKASVLHRELKKLGFESDTIVANTILALYTKLGDIKSARDVFDSMTACNVATWTSLILGYVENGEPLAAVDVFLNVDCAPSSVLYVAAVKAFQGLRQLDRGFCLSKVVEIHKQAWHDGFGSDKALAASLLEVYGQCGLMIHARAVFSMLETRDVVLWNCLTLGYVANGQSNIALDLFWSIDCEPSQLTYIAALRACGSLDLRSGFCLETGIKVHRLIQESGFDSDIGVVNSLIGMYSRCRSMEHARIVLKKLYKKDSTSWNSLMRGYMEHGECLKVINLYREMDVRPDSVTYTLVLKSCGTFYESDVSQEEVCFAVGASVHAQLEEQGLDSGLFIATHLIEMYGKFRQMHLAYRVFEKIKQPDVVAWNAIIKGYIDNGSSFTALEMFDALDCEPNDVTCILILKALGNLASDNESLREVCLQRGIDLHEQARRGGFSSSLNVANTLINMYSKCSCMRRAREVFDSIKIWDVVSWTCLLQGYVTNGESSVALELFSKMTCEPGPITYMTMLKACVSLAAERPSERQVFLETGISIHKRVKDSGLDSVPTVITTLVDMYSKIGCTGLAKETFDSIPSPCIATVNSLIMCYVDNGEGSKALEIFTQADCSPNSITYVGALKACGSLASLSRGKHVHGEVCRCVGEESQLVSNALLDFYVRFGGGTAERVLEGMHSPDATSWNTLIGGYSALGDSSKVLSLVRSMQEAGVRMDTITCTSVLTVCSHAGLLREGKAFMEWMTELGIGLNVEHYNCLVDMLGRANKLQEALDVVRGAPVEANTVTWMTLLGACRKWKNVELGKVAYDALVASGTVKI